MLNKIHKYLALLSKTICNSNKSLPFVVQLQKYLVIINKYR